jgi:hypothetical protein
LAGLPLLVFTVQTDLLSARIDSDKPTATHIISLRISAVNRILAARLSPIWWWVYHLPNPAGSPLARGSVDRIRNHDRKTS